MSQCQFQLIELKLKLKLELKLECSNEPVVDVSYFDAGRRGH